jgi:hypothetical protein
MVLLSAEALVWLTATAMFVAGIASDVFGVLRATTIQREIPERVLSRVSSYDWNLQPPWGGTRRCAALREYAERHERAALVAKHFHAAQQWDYEGWQRRRVEDKQNGA